MVVGDAEHLTAHFDDEKHEDVEDEAQEQLAFADIVLLNKIGIEPEEAELQKTEAWSTPTRRSCARSTARWTGSGCCAWAPWTCSACSSSCPSS